MSEAYARLAIVLPLLLLGLGALLYAAKRGLIRLPGATLGTPPLRIVQIAALGPGARLAVVEFAGTQHLLGIARNGITFLPAGLAKAPAPAPDSLPVRNGEPFAAVAPLSLGEEGGDGCEPHGRPLQ